MISQIDTQIKQLLTVDQVMYYKAIPSKITDDDELLLLSPLQIEAHKSGELQMIVGKKIVLEIISQERFNQLVAQHYRASAFEKVKTLQSITDALDEIIATTQAIGGSDIHIEPTQLRCRIRIRLDGALKTFYDNPIEEHALLVNKIKIKAGLNISEKRRNQDGRITQVHPTTGKKIDIRVSSVPSLHGEKIVMRLLESEDKNLNIEAIGFNEEQLAIYKTAYSKTKGIILISGPTGSGKTSTLYATLKELNKETVNIMTVEDPIEYTLSGINQIQVKHDIGFDFANALKSFLRQDPDIIMVGEIRDQETAQMAVKAALTGHLVFSTIHTNSAIGTVDRLLDMGIPKYLIANTLNLSVAQRLVRVLCVSCKVKNEDTIVANQIHAEISDHLKPVGCAICHYTGYSGRTALFELLEITPEFSKVIKSELSDYSQYLASSSYKSIKIQALQLLKKGQTSYEEIFPLLLD